MMYLTKQVAGLVVNNLKALEQYVAGRPARIRVEKMTELQLNMVGWLLVSSSPGVQQIPIKAQMETFIERKNEAKRLNSLKFVKKSKRAAYL